MGITGFVQPAVLTEARRDVAVLASTVSQVDTIEINTPADYIEADELLSLVKVAKLKATLKLEKLDNSVKAIKAAAKELSTLYNELLEPFDDAMATIRAKMKAFKEEERRVLWLAENERTARERAAQAEIDAKRLAEQNAATESMRKRLATQREKLESQQEAIAAEPQPTPVKTVGSTTRVNKRRVVTDPAKFFACLAAKEIPYSLVEVAATEVNRYFQGAHTHPLAHYGVDEIDEITIVTR